MAGFSSLRLMLFVSPPHTPTRLYTYKLVLTKAWMHAHTHTHTEQ
uniref:Uncharacterized protein n=1 Tax=Anguilla anguilla TaxID=7936 RepID=A0A0E9S3B0_ANGAN